jgi:hypothetical protein
MCECVPYIPCILYVLTYTFFAYRVILLPCSSPAVCCVCCVCCCVLSHRVFPSPLPVHRYAEPVHRNPRIRPYLYRPHAEGPSTPLHVHHCMYIIACTSLHVHHCTYITVRHIVISSPRAHNKHTLAHTRPVTRFKTPSNSLLTLSPPSLLLLHLYRPHAQGARPQPPLRLESRARYIGCRRHQCTKRTRRRRWRQSWRRRGKRRRERRRGGCAGVSGAPCLQDGPLGARPCSVPPCATGSLRRVRAGQTLKQFLVINGFLIKN